MRFRPFEIGNNTGLKVQDYAPYYWLLLQFSQRSIRTENPRRINEERVGCKICHSL